MNTWEYCVRSIQLPDESDSSERRIVSSRGLTKYQFERVIAGVETDARSMGQTGWELVAVWQADVLGDAREEIYPARSSAAQKTLVLFFKRQMETRS